MKSYFDLSSLKLKSYRQKQFNEAVFQQLVADINEIQTFSKELRTSISKDLVFPTIHKANKTHAKDESTLKILFEGADKNTFESVLLLHERKRRTVCVSTQIGCPMKCTFCATGQMGFTRNLTTREIVDQVLHFARFLKKQSEKVTNIVFMGMGEPFLNYDSVVESVEILTDSEQFGLGSRHITISTVGIVEPMRLFFAKFPQVNLAISLHSANQSKREELMPVAAETHIDQIAEYITYHIEKYNRRVSLEYLLLNDINDTKEDLRNLVDFFEKIGNNAKRLVHVNLIPYNKIDGIVFEPSPPRKVRQFKKHLIENGINTTIRKSLGQQDDAACGMLKNSHTPDTQDPLAKHNSNRYYKHVP